MRSFACVGPSCAHPNQASSHTVVAQSPLMCVPKPGQQPYGCLISTALPRYPKPFQRQTQEKLLTPLHPRFIRFILVFGGCIDHHLLTHHQSLRCARDCGCRPFLLHLLRDDRSIDRLLLRTIVVAVRRLLCLVFSICLLFPVVSPSLKARLG